MTTFTTSETKLLTACMRCMNSDVSNCIDFDKVALEAGYKDAKNAKVMFWRLKKAKLDGATTGTTLPKPTTPTKKGTGATTAARKAGNGGVVKGPAGGGAKGGTAQKGAKGRKTMLNAGAVGLGAEVGDNDEGFMVVKAENSGRDDENGGGLKSNGSGGDVVKDEHDGATGRKVVNGFTAVNRASVSETDELGEQEEA